MGLDEKRRSQTVMMARIRNEQRWIERCLDRTWPVAKYIVLWDDGSDDRTNELAVYSSFHGQHQLGPNKRNGVRHYFNDDRHLVYMQSPFRPALNETYAVNEIRDKNALWELVKGQVPSFTYVLCLDGDEMLSNRFLRNAEQWWQHLDDGIDLMHLPFVYLWDREDQQRVDGIYGLAANGIAKLNFPRLFTIARWTPQQVFESHFEWFGTKGGFHCGSIPRAQGKTDMCGGLAHDPVVHFGYLDEAERQRKYVFYNKIDPGNVVEGEYKHIIGEPDVHAPGPVELVPYKDE